MATETPWSCPLCHNTRNDVAFTLPCHHQFCLGCILRWVKVNPACPLCSRTVQTVRFSERGEQDCIQFEITAPQESPETTTRARRAPFRLHESSLRRPALLPPSPEQGTPCPPELEAAGTEPVGGILPEVWAALFRRRQHLLEPVRSWLHQRLVALYREQWWRAEAAEGSILHGLCACGPHAEILVEVLEPILSENTAPLIHDIVRAIEGRCSDEAQRLLGFHQPRDQDSRAAASTSSTSSSSSSSSSSSQERRAVPRVQEEAGTSQPGPQGSASCPQPVPDPAEQEVPQEVCAGPRAQGSSHSPSAPTPGRSPSPGRSQHPPKRKVSSPQDCPLPRKKPPCQQR